jgi:hypothetical protein
MREAHLVVQLRLYTKSYKKYFQALESISRVKG